MSAPAPSRRSRGRVLIVGEPTTLRARLPEFTETPEYASDLFDAIARLGTRRRGDVRAPITGVMVPDGAIDGSGPFAIDAVRQLDPALVIIRLAEANGAASGVADAWFDATIAGPVSALMLERLLGPGIATGDGAPAPPTFVAAPADDPEPARDAEPHSTPHTDAADEPNREPADDADASSFRAPFDADDAPAAHAVTEVPAPEPPPAPAPPAAEDALGDIDLVRAVLDSALIAEEADASGRLAPGPILDRALTVIRQRTGWTNVAYHPPTDADAIGALTADGAPDDDLAAWAQWLAPWLELDQRHRAFRLASFRDDLTGAWNRRYFSRFLDDTLRRARELRRPVSVMVFDIDDFKHYNDQYGHEAGDTVLVETVSLLQSVIRQCDRVCRIGGDEFVVVFADLDEPRELGSSHPADVTSICRRFQEQVATMRFRSLGLDAPGALSISAGLAAYPWDAHDASTLLRLADERALASKRRGKNTITFGPTPRSI